ncbi:tudor domain-containing 6 [Patella vulgata]|uniref:tudor domain-containing 6 n=1 Tax=Patella vulgata TaxID=6465 RepID=UPI002180308E|nr:tudor domain-containing 6 [Patella vulgata]
MYSQRPNGVGGAGVNTMSARNKSLSAPFKDQDISLGALMKIHVTHIASPQHFQVQLDSCTEILNSLMDDIFGRYGNLQEGEMAMKSFAVGQACVAKFDEDENWYRAKITGLTADNLVEVFFVDYGNTEIVAATKVKSIAPDLLDLPAQALTCALAGVSPLQGFWPPEHTAQFEDIALDQCFTACFKTKHKDDQIYLIKLISEDGEFINETFGVKTNSMCVEEDTVLDMKRQIRMDNSGDKLQVTVSKGNTSDNTVNCAGDNDSRFRVLELSIGKLYDVSIIFSVSPSQFWCQPAQNADSLQVIVERLSATYEKMPENAHLLRSPIPGTICAAKFTEDDLWYRAIVTSSDSQSADVFFVDYGNSETVSLNLLKELAPDLHDLPSQAVECMLGNVCPLDNSWSSKVIDEFEKWIYDREMEIKIIGREGQIYIVNLIDSVEGSDIGEKLIKTNLVLPSSLNQSVNPYGDIEISFPSKSSVFVSWAESPNSFWIQLSEKHDSLEEMTESLQTYCDENGVVATNVQPGVPVLAKYSEDESWYRGVVQSLTGSTAIILFTDYGNTDTLPIAALIKVPQEYLEIPSYALHCRLDKIRPVQSSNSWIVDAKDFLEEFTVDGAMCHFIRQDKNAVIVEIYKGDENIEEKLVKAGVARPNTNQSNSGGQYKSGFPNAVKLSPNDSGKIYVSHVDAVDSFFCQLSHFLDNLDQIMEQLEVAYSEGQGQRITPKPGSPCAAKFNEDGAWYRAEILSCDGNNIRICFVDYGNYDTVSADDICVLKEEFLSFPTQAIHCKLDIENTGTELADKLNDMVVEKELMINVLSVNGDIHTIDIIDESQSITAMLLSASPADIPRAPVIPLTPCQFKPTKVPVGVKPVPAYTSFIVSPGKLYLQLAGIDDQLAEISKKLQDFCSTNESVPDVCPGDGCTALFAEDGEWYRAKVMNCQGSEVKVLFVDYGNSENIEKDGLRFLPPDVTDIPPFGIECSLDDLAPQPGPDWSAEATSMLESLALDRELTCGFISAASVIITIDGEELGDKLVDADLAKRISAPPVPKQYTYPNKPANEMKAFITHIDSDGVFYVQLSNMEQEIINLAKLMQREGKTAAQFSSKTTLEKGLVCCAKFKVDQNWYRGTVEAAEETKVTVRFVDYGNCDEVQSKDLRKCTLPMMKDPIQAFPCKMKNLTDWNADIEGRLNDMTDEITLNFLSEDQPFEVEAKTKRGKDIADLLMNPPRPRVYAKAVLPTEDVAAFISHVDSDNTIHVQLARDAEEIDELSNKIAEFPIEEVPERLNSGYACAALFSQDKAWYRAIVTKVGPKVDVHFVDFGNGDSLPVNDLKELPEELLDVPPYAYHCKVHGMNNWTQDAKNLLDAYMEKEITVNFQSDTCPYMVKLTCDGHELSRILMRADVKSFLQQMAPSKIILGCVSHTEDDGRFYLHLNQNDDVLDNISHDLQAYYNSDEAEVAYDLKIGQPCCAKFPEDNLWYRAIVEETHDSNTKVLFCDFGNCSFVESHDIKFMEKKFIHHPALAYECKLNNAGKWTEKKQEKFTAMTEGKELNIEFVTKSSPYMVVVTRSLADVLQDDADLSVCEEADDVEEEGEVISDYPAQSPSTDQCYVSHTDGDGVFYIQLVSEEEKLTQLSEKLQENYSESSNSLKETKIGSVCVAKFTDDDMWYRARVEVINDDDVTVRFVDYGNTDTVSVDRIKKSSKADVETPPLSYKCRLHGLNVWTEETTNEFENATADRTLQVKFVSSEDAEFSVELKTEEGSDIHAFFSNGDATKDVDETQNSEELKSEGGKVDPEAVESDQAVCNTASEVELEENESSKPSENKSSKPSENEGSQPSENESSQPSENESSQQPESVSSQPSETHDTETDTNNSAESDTYLDVMAEKMKEIDIEKDKDIIEENGEFQPVDGKKDADKTENDKSMPDVDYKVEKLVEGSRIAVSISFSYSPSEFYIVAEKSTKNLDKLTNEMLEYYNGLPETEEQLTSPSIHQPIAVYCQDDQLWHRGRIEKITDEGCEVFFVDHGNLATVLLTDIRKLCPEFLNLPIQSVECCLAGVQPNAKTDEWSEQAIEEFVKISAYNNLIADIIKVGENGNCLVQVMHMGISVSQMLIDKNHGKLAATPVCISKKIKRVFSDSQSPAKKLKMTDLDGADAALDEEDENERILKCISAELHNREKIHASVCHIESPSKFYCHLTFAADALQTQMEKLQTAYSEADVQIANPDDISTGDIGVIQSSDWTDSKFYRTKIEAINEDDLTVRFVDYGHCSVVTKHKFLNLQKPFYQLPSQAVCCSLHRVIAPANKWSQEARLKFQELVDNKELVLVVRKKMSNALSVDLYDEQVSIGQSLVNADLAIGDDTELSSDEIDDIGEFGLDLPEIRINNESLEDSQLQDSVLNSEKEWDDFCDPELELDTEYEISIIQEGALPDDFKGHLVEYEKQNLETLFEKIAKEMESKEKDSDWSPEEGRPCLVLYGEKWNRGRVSKIDGDKIKVYLVDVGEEVEVDIVAAINKEFLLTPAKIINFRLSEVTPVNDNWSDDAIKHFKEYINGKMMAAYLSTISDDGYYEVSLSDASDIDTVILNRQLVDLGFAKVIPASQLEIQIQMEGTLNDTARMGELEESFQNVSFLRENSIGETEGEELGEGFDDTCATMNTTGHSICLLDETTELNLDISKAERSAVEFERDTPTDSKNTGSDDDSQIHTEALNNQDETKQDGVTDESVTKTEKETDQLSETEKTENETKKVDTDHIEPEDNKTVSDLHDGAVVGKLEDKNDKIEVADNDSINSQNDQEKDVESEEKDNKSEESGINNVSAESES